MQRSNIVTTARLLLSTPYANGVLPSSGVELPTAIDCSGAISWVSLRLYHEDGRLVAGNANMVTVSTIWANLPQPSARPQLADLVFYASVKNPNVPSHVMMLNERGGAIGSCHLAREVHEYSVLDYAPKVWKLAGFRAFPV